MMPSVRNFSISAKRFIDAPVKFRGCCYGYNTMSSDSFWLSDSASSNRSERADGADGKGGLCSEEHGRRGTDRQAHRPGIDLLRSAQACEGDIVQRQSVGA